LDLVGYQPKEEQPLKVELDENDDGDEVEAEVIDPERKWLLPAVMGYATITPFAQRVGVREDVPHAFAEPLVGLVHYKSVRQVQEDDSLFWSGSWIRDDVFVVTSHPISHFS